MICGVPEYLSERVWPAGGTPHELEGMWALPDPIAVKLVHDGRGDAALTSESAPYERDCHVSFCGWTFCPQTCSVLTPGVSPLPSALILWASDHSAWISSFLYLYVKLFGSTFWWSWSLPGPRDPSSLVGTSQTLLRKVSFKPFTIIKYVWEIYTLAPPWGSHNAHQHVKGSEK